MFRVTRTDELMEEKVKDKEEGTEPRPGNKDIQRSGRGRGASQEDGGEVGGGKPEWRGAMATKTRQCFKKK